MRIPDLTERFPEGYRGIDTTLPRNYYDEPDYRDCMCGAENEEDCECYEK